MLNTGDFVKILGGRKGRPQKFRILHIWEDAATVVDKTGVEKEYPLDMLAPYPVITRKKKVKVDTSSSAISGEPYAEDPAYMEKDTYAD